MIEAAVCPMLLLKLTDVRQLSLALAVALTLAGAAGAQVFGPPALISDDTSRDQYARVATDRAGNWVAVWYSDDSLGGTIGTDFDILVSRSSDDGETWSAPSALNLNASYDTGADYWPEIVTDRVGRWVAVWQSNDSLLGTVGTDDDVFVAHSITNGASWTIPRALNGYAETDADRDYSPKIATDRAGNYVVVWDSRIDLGGTVGTDHDIFVSYSTTHGSTWSYPEALNSGAETDVIPEDDVRPVVTTDSAGNWLVAWFSKNPLGGTVGLDRDIMVSRSSNVGASWTDMEPLNNNAGDDTRYDEYPHIATDEAGSWLATWVSWDALYGTIGEDSDILVARSLDAGATWSDPTPLNDYAATDYGDDYSPQLVSNGTGHWVAVWDTYETFGGTLGSDRDSMLAHSTDSGATWSTHRWLKQDADTDTADDAFPQVTTDGAGAWVAMWREYEDSDESQGILVAIATFPIDLAAVPAAGPIALATVALSLLAGYALLRRR